jgi:hypothetical protein
MAVSSRCTGNEIDVGRGHASEALPEARSATGGKEGAAHWCWRRTGRRWPSRCRRSRRWRGTGRLRALTTGWRSCPPQTVSTSPATPSDGCGAWPSERENGTPPASFACRGRLPRCRRSSAAARHAPSGAGGSRCGDPRLSLLRAVGQVADGEAALTLELERRASLLSTVPDFACHVPAGADALFEAAAAPRLPARAASGLVRPWPPRAVHWRPASWPLRGSEAHAGGGSASPRRSACLKRGNPLAWFQARPYNPRRMWGTFLSSTSWRRSRRPASW